MAAAAEVTFICMDNSLWMHGYSVFKAQLDAIKYYSDIKLKCNPENRIGLFRMASYGYGPLLFPTNDLQQILSCLKGIDFECGGQVEFADALEDIGSYFRRIPPNMKRRILVCVGSPINLHDYHVMPLGMILKQRDIALDVVNFFVWGRDSSQVDRSIHYGKYQFAREELIELVALVNDKDNSHMVDVDEIPVRDVLSTSILKKNLRYLRKKDQRTAKKKVNVKQELEPSRNEKNKAAAEYGKHFHCVIDLKPRENEKVKSEAARCMRVA